LRSCAKFSHRLTFIASAAGNWRRDEPARSADRRNAGPNGEEIMDLITALAVSIGVLGGIATFVSLSPIGLGLQIWAAFIAWATFYHCGGKEAGLTKTITHTVFGAIMAYIALLLVTQIPLGAALGVPLWAGICVLITVFILVYAAKQPMLSDIPASVLGYAAVAAMALAGNKLGAVTTGSMENPFIVIVLSLIAGAVLGYISEKIAGALVKRQALPVGAPKATR
jgi:hypothetical protein